MTGTSFPSYVVVYSYRCDVPSAYTVSRVCLTPPPTSSILLVALLKPVPGLNFDLAMFIFQVPSCGFVVWPMTSATAATLTRTPARTVERVMLPSFCYDTTPVHR